VRNFEAVLVEHHSKHVHGGGLLSGRVVRERQAARVDVQQRPDERALGR